MRNFTIGMDLDGPLRQIVEDSHKQAQKRREKGIEPDSHAPSIDRLASLTAGIPVSSKQHD